MDDSFVFTMDTPVDRYIAFNRFTICGQGEAVNGRNTSSKIRSGRYA